MTTPFVSLQTPPGSAAQKYDNSKSYIDQVEGIPEVFLEAMSVREAVFVEEQGVPLEYEFDAEDSRSFHWVAYASIGAPPSSSKSADPLSRRKSTATRLAVGTMRMVPPPNPHTSAGLNVETPGEATGNPDNEPYAKLGRLATLKDFRKLGLGQLLINTVLEWASAHAEDILPPPSSIDREAARVDGNGNLSNVDKWRGLVLIHAQSSIQKFWAKFGFVRDDGMGEWMEEGIPHVGMWKRVQLKEN